MARITVVLLVVLVLLAAGTTYLGFTAYTTVQAYGARFAFVEQELTTVKGQADRLRAESEATAGRLKRVEDEVARFRR